MHILPDILKKYREDIAEYEKELEVRGKNIELANAEQPAYSAYYDQKRVEIGSLLRYMDMRVKSARAAALKMIAENVKIDLSDRHKEKLVDNDKNVLTIYQLFLEVEEVYELLCMICKNFEQRSYSLTNIVKIREHQLQEYHIRNGITG